MTRREARELIMKMLYEKSFHDETQIAEILKQNLEEVQGKVKHFVEEEFLGIINHEAEIDTMISQSASNWSIDRIAKIDLMLLRMAIYEMKWVEDVPARVAINEAIEIAKLYSTDKSPKFINGVLGKVSKVIEG
ncbi:MAG: transcription antitermination factor NusB [Cellulosilyticaceae bacterium]